MAAISRPSPPASSDMQQLLRDTGLVRQIRAEFHPIRQVLEANPQLRDETTGLIRDWFTHFESFFNRQDGLAETALQQFIPLMQGILTDPLSRNPLGEEPLLGSDGRTYSRASLSIHFAGVPEPFRKRSPLAPNDPTPFTTQPHPVAQELINWLRLRHAYHPSPDEQTAFQEFAAHGRLPAIPTPASAIRDERFRRIVAIQQAREQQEAMAVAAGVDALVDAEIRAVVDAQFAPVDAAIDAAAARNIARIDAHAERMHGDLELLAAGTARLQRDVADLRRRNRDLNAQMDDMDHLLSEKEKATARLGTAVRELEIAQKERESAWGGALFQTLLIVGACAFGTWALASALSATAGVSGTMIPMQDGAMININVGCPVS